MRNRTSSTATTPKTNSQNSRISSALVSIMEQGGLVELVPGRRQASGTVVTRMLGDPSTGTAPSPLMPENSVEAAGAPHRPPMLMHVSSEQTAVASPLDERAYLALPDTPRFSSEEAPSPTEASHTPRSGSVMKATEFNGLPVLVVDDDPLTRMLMKRMLTRLGCRVTTAENGELALQRILGEDARASQPPDITDAGVEEKFAIVFLDNQMPVMSGLEAVGRLRDAGRSDFVVGVTGNALLSDQEEYLDAGADQCVLCVVSAGLWRLTLFRPQRVDEAGVRAQSTAHAEHGGRTPQAGRLCARPSTTRARHVHPQRIYFVTYLSKGIFPNLSSSLRRSYCIRILCSISPSLFSLTILSFFEWRWHAYARISGLRLYLIYSHCTLCILSVACAHRISYTQHPLPPPSLSVAGWKAFKHLCLRETARPRRPVSR